MSNYPKISVVTITYGHENYITQTLDSVLMQDYPGEIEFIIANDNSPDITDGVIKNYLSSKKIPSNFIIKYTKHVLNKGMSHNFVWALQQASGKYIAICEGDDYWIDPLKLQKQVGFLEANEDYVLCFTNRDILENSSVKITTPLHNKCSFNKSEIPYIHVPTLTTVFRNVVNEIPNQMSNKMIDASLFLFLSQFGSFNYLNLKTAIYRMHDGGIYSGNSELINHLRSVNARLSAWRYLKKIDKFSLSEVLIDWIILKKNLERSNRMLFPFCRSLFLQYYFSFYKFMYKSKDI